MARRVGISDVSNLAMWMTWVWGRGVCNLRKSNRWWQKSGKRRKKICWWLPDWEVEGVVAAKKDLLVVTRLGSLAEVMEARGVGSCLNGKSTICSTA